MKRVVRFTTEARSQLHAAYDWWRIHRDEPRIFAAEVRRAVSILRANPEFGTPYAHQRLTGLRRLFLPRIGMHLYYVVVGNEVRIRALWHARRGRGPTLRRPV